MKSPHSSLVKYDNAILISTTEGKGAGRRGKKRLTPTEDILNSILPPREWTEDTQLWVQYVSSTPATTSDVLLLEEQLNHRLQQRQARETGICPIREELYAQCFDELIRQITINCSERGLLLLRVRDELRMAITTYQTLYESSIAYGMRNALMSEQSKGGMASEIQKLQEETRALEAAVAEEKKNCDEKEEAEEKRITEETARCEEELGTLRQHNDELKAKLESILASGVGV